MFDFSFTFWTVAIVALGVSIALAIVSARINLPVLGAVAAAPVAIGLLVQVLGLSVDAPHPIYQSLVVVELFVLGVVAGSPLTLFVLGLAESRTVQPGIHGGIMATPQRAVDAAAHSATRSAPPGWRSSLWVGGEDRAAEPTEVLRGGATIGYLERIAVLGCLAVGRIEGIAVIVAIKGLGRFSELDSPEARERFIIGTLVSLIWASAAGILLNLSVG